MLWLSLGVPITEPRRVVQTGRVLACLAGTSSVQVITQQQLIVVTFVAFSVSKWKHNWRTQRCIAPKNSKIQPVLPKAWGPSIRMARRKTWPEGVVEKRGRKGVVGKRTRFSYRVCESQCEGECRLRALHVSQLHRQPTPVRQYLPAVRWLVKIAVTSNITSSMQIARRKTWPECVAVRCGRKAWLKGVVLRRACRDQGRELTWLPVVSARSFGVQLHDNNPACIKATQGINSCA